MATKKIYEQQCAHRSRDFRPKKADPRYTYLCDEKKHIYIYIYIECTKTSGPFCNALHESAPQSGAALMQGIYAPAKAVKAQNGARTLLGAKGIATRNKGLTTSNKKLVETRIN